MKKLQNQNTVLLIESNSDWLKEVSSLLEEAGYKVFTATGGDRGFCIARRVRPDLIVCEAALPDISGVQLCYMIRADKDLYGARFVLMGDLSVENGSAVLEGFRAGADSCFERNCDRQFLAAKLGQLLALQRAETKLCQCLNLLRHSKSHLVKIIKDTADLIAALNPTFRFAVLEDYAVFDSRKTLNSEAERAMSGKNENSTETRRQSLPIEERTNTAQISNKLPEKVYYEIVS